MQARPHLIDVRDQNRRPFQKELRLDAGRVGDRSLKWSSEGRDFLRHPDQTSIIGDPSRAVIKRNHDPVIVEIVFDRLQRLLNQYFPFQCWTDHDAGLMEKRQLADFMLQIDGDLFLLQVGLP